jgi:hypothetical protein
MANVGNSALKKLQQKLIDLEHASTKVILLAGERSGGATTNTSAVITMTSTTGLAAGMLITSDGAGITAGTKILTVDNGTTVTMTAAATSTTSGRIFTFGPDVDMDTISQFSGIEVSTAGYTGGFGGSGRKSVSGTVTEDDTNNKTKFDAADHTWTTIGPASSGPIITHAVVVSEQTNDAGSPMVSIHDLSPHTQLNGGNFSVLWHANGIIEFANV